MTQGLYRSFLIAELDIRFPMILNVKTTETAIKHKTKVKKTTKNMEKSDLQMITVKNKREF